MNEELGRVLEQARGALESIKRVVDAAKQSPDFQGFFNGEFSEELFDLERRGGDEASEAVKSLLCSIEAIDRQRGTAKVRYGNIEKNNYNEKIDQYAEVLGRIDDLLNPSGSVVSKKAILDIFEEVGFDKRKYGDVIQILVLTGSGSPNPARRSGGLVSPQKNEDVERQLNAAREEYQRSEKSRDDETPEGRQHESILYGIAAQVIAKDGFVPIVLGVNRRLRGEWNTPDLIGYRMVQLKVFGGSELEVVTVEVKWEVSKSAIAEANSHQRLGHRSYLFVDQEIEQIAEGLIREIAQKGLGLICKKGASYMVHISSQDNTVSRIALDDFLHVALDEGTRGEILDSIARQYASDTLGRLLNRGR